jgi:nucleoside-diphosphate-sugar epimerase
MLKIAMLGANGFIGSRAVEMMHLGDMAEVRPIVRHLSSLARLSRFDLDCRVADGFDQTAISTAVQGCDVVVHAIAGDRKTILGTLAPVYAAAQQAGVRRLIYLSSASVHGQAPAPGTDETSPLSDRQAIAYNNTKVQAERAIRQLRQRGDVELVILRPGIVLGPRSYWVTSFAEALLQQQAYLVNRGQGICNSVYVDNLIHAIYLAATNAQADQQTFIIGDREQVTWADVYRPIVTAFDIDLEQIPEMTYTYTSPSLEERIESVLASKASLGFLSLFPNHWRQAARSAMSTLLHPASTTEEWRMPESIQTTPAVTLEMALLQQCQYKLPHTKAEQLLGYCPIVPFAEASRRSIAWLKFAGFPVISSHENQLRSVQNNLSKPVYSSKRLEEKLI